MQDNDLADIAATWECAMRAAHYEKAWAISDHVPARRDPATRDQEGGPYHRRWVWNGSAIDGRNCYR